MKAIEAVKTAAQRANMPTTHIGPAMGKTRGYVANTAARGSTPQADTLAAMLRTCGYALAAVPVDAVPDSAIVIDGPDAGA